MNITKVFSFILALHLGVILVLFVQPGCRTTGIQPPSQSDFQTSSLGSEELSSADSDLASIYQSSQELGIEDLSAFNDIEGFEQEDDGLSVSVMDNSTGLYVVQNGDTLWDLARKFDTTVNELCKLNGISKKSILRIGMELEVPKAGESVMSIKTESAAVYQPTDFEGTGQVYKVVSGDSLSKIASKYDISLAAIKATNGLSSDTILIGQELLIPIEGTAGAKQTASVEPVLIEPIEDSSGSEVIKNSSSVEPVELEPVENTGKDIIELDMESLPQVDILRVPVQSE